MLLKRGMIGLIIVIATGVLALAIARGQEWLVNRDFFTYWAGGRGLLDGVNLHATNAWWNIHQSNESTWFPNPVFIYAPPTAIFFAPLAALSPEVAGVVWIWLSEIFVVIAVVIIAKTLEWMRLAWYAPFWLAGIALFIPVLLTLLMGQASALILLLVVVTAALWDRGRWFAGGLLLGLTIVKPQAIAFLLPLLALWLILKRRWDALFGLGLSLSISAIAAFALFPNFISDWQNAVLTKVGGVASRMPTLWGLTADLFDASPLATASAILLVLVAITASVILVVREKNNNPLTVTSILLIPSLLVTPYLWNYDQILLLMPLLVALIRFDQRRVSFAVVLLLLFALDALAIMFLGIAAVRLRDTLSILLPVVVGIMLWIALKNPSMVKSWERHIEPKSI